MGNNNLDKFLDEGLIKYIDVKYMPINYVLKYVADYKQNDELLDKYREWEKLKQVNDELDSICKHICDTVEDVYEQHELTEKVKCS